MNNPEYVKIKNKKYKINTDFRVALKCNEVSIDNTICDYEKMLAIIYLLFGDEGLKDRENYNELLELAYKYLNCGEEIIENDDEIDMDFKQDFKLIEASFRSDYGIILSKEKMHWWDFYMYLNGLTENCILNRIRELRTYDISDISDPKDKKKIQKAKKRFELKNQKRNLTQKESESLETFYKLTGIKRKE